MSQGFNWRSEEDERWEEPPTEAEAAPRRRRPWRYLLLILAVVILAGLAGYRWVDRRAEAAAAAAQADVINTHNLVRYAAARGDTELFRSLLSGRSAWWVEAEERLMAEGLLFDRAPLGLQLESEPETLSLADLSSLEQEESGIVDVTLSPDLTSAELVFARSYRVTGNDEASRSVTLEQTAVYRLGADRWLLAPPERDFWGPWLSSRGEYLTLAYPERDAEISRRLIVELDRRLEEMCRVLADLNCPFNLHVNLRLEDDPGTIPAMRTPIPLHVVGGELQLDLPAPTLVGRPVDEAGYRVLAQGYSIQLITAVVSHLVGYACCEHAPFYQALLDYQLSQLGLRSWPVNRASYERVLAEEVSLGALQTFWNETDPTLLQGEEGWQVYAAVDFFLNSQPGRPAPNLAPAVTPLTPASMQRRMERSQIFLAWLALLFADRPEIALVGTGIASELERDWHFYAYAQTLRAQEPLPLPLPEQDIQLICMGWDMEQVTEISVLYRHNLATGSWESERTGVGFTFMNPFPDDDGVLLNNFVGAFEGWMTHLWRQGRGTRIFNTTEAFLSVGQMDPTGERFVVYGYPEQPQEEQPQAAAFLADVNECNRAECQLQPLAGVPTWSPDGLQTILMEPRLRSNQFFELLALDGRMVTAEFSDVAPSPSRLFRADGAGRPLEESEELLEIGVGYAPFWLDNETYGYIRSTADAPSGSRQEVVIASIRDDEAHPVVALEDLLEYFPVEDQTYQLNLRYVLASPAEPDLLFMVVFDTVGRRAYVFSFDRTSGEIALRLASNYFDHHSLGLSPDGRWLVLTGMEQEAFGTESPSFTLYLHDVVAGETRHYFVNNSLFFFASPGYDWTADGRWLAMMLGDNMLALLAPEEGYIDVIDHDYGACTSLAWVDAREE